MLTETRHVELNTESLVAYLRLKDWHESANNGKWQVFRGYSDINGDELELVLPRNRQAYDIESYHKSAVELLSIVNREPIENTIARIINFDTDVLNLRNKDTGQHDYIPLKLAGTQVPKLKLLVKQSANSEVNLQPYHKTNYDTSLAKRMERHCQFAHTSDQSFGFVIRSPVIDETSRYEQLTFQLQELNNFQFIPPERRVMERITRGLIAARGTERDNSADRLVRSYGSGFSGNMCKTIIELSDGRRATVEYNIMWSPRIKPSDDIAEITPILLNEVHYEYLEIAAIELEKLQEDDTYHVRGLVGAIESFVPPSHPGAKRSVVIVWNNKPDSNREVHLVVELGLKDYHLALEAHKAEQAVTLTGEAKVVGNTWRLFNPRDFSVVPKGK